MDEYRTTNKRSSFDRDMSLQISKSISGLKLILNLIAEEFVILHIIKMFLQDVRLSYQDHTCPLLLNLAKVRIKLKRGKRFHKATTIYNTG